MSSMAAGVPPPPPPPGVPPVAGELDPTALPRKLCAPAMPPGPSSPPLAALTPRPPPAPMLRAGLGTKVAPLLLAVEAEGPWGAVGGRPPEGGRRAEAAGDDAAPPCPLPGPEARGVPPVPPSGVPPPPPAAAAIAAGAAERMEVSRRGPEKAMKPVLPFWGPGPSMSTRGSESFMHAT